jgi:hypothetical protein
MEAAISRQESFSHYWVLEGGPWLELAVCWHSVPILQQDGVRHVQGALPSANYSRHATVLYKAALPASMCPQYDFPVRPQVT